MKYIIGIDGGGTKSHSYTADENLNILHEYIAGPSTFLLLGEETVAETIKKHLDSAVEALGCNYSDMSAVLLGTTGAGRRSDAERFEIAFTKYIQKQGLPTIPLYVESDARIALEGAFSGKPGSILIAGTGSIMFGKNGSGEIFRVGGFGRFIGDEGSGYMIGKKGLTAVAREFDGRGVKTLITEKLKTGSEIVDGPSLITAIYTNNYDIASAARFVIDAASEGDEIARGILDEECNNLIDHISTMKTKIGEPTLLLSFIGGTIANDTFYSSMLKEKITQLLPDVSVLPQENNPTMGALIMAKQRFSKQ